MLDLNGSRENKMSDISNDDDAIRSAFETTKRIAVLGIKTSGPANYVPEYLHEKGYDVHGANPKKPELESIPVVSSLADIETPDLVIVFRKSDALAMHLDELIATGAKTVWFQLGIRNDEVAKSLSEAGIDVVQDKCSMVEHRRLI